MFSMAYPLPMRWAGGAASASQDGTGRPEAEAGGVRARATPVPGGRQMRTAAETSAPLQPGGHEANTRRRCRIWKLKQGKPPHLHTRARPCITPYPRR